jgi:hypothetical protein
MVRWSFFDYLGTHLTLEAFSERFMIFRYYVGFDTLV